LSIWNQDRGANETRRGIPRNPAAGKFTTTHHPGSTVRTPGCSFPEPVEGQARSNPRRPCEPMISGQISTRLRDSTGLPFDRLRERTPHLRTANQGMVDFATDRGVRRPGRRTVERSASSRERSSAPPPTSPRIAAVAALTLIMIGSAVANTPATAQPGGADAQRDRWELCWNPRPDRDGMQVFEREHPGAALTVGAANSDGNRRASVSVSRASDSRSSDHPPSVATMEHPCDPESDHNNRSLGAVRVVADNESGVSGCQDPCDC